MTDPHVRTEEHTQTFRDAVHDLNEIAPQPEFVIITGDLTELSSVKETEQYAEIAKKIKVPVYHGIGNHDSRWTATGKAHFERILGPLYQSFDYKDVHFALLDSSLELEQYGHISQEQLRWLDEDLRGVPADKTKVVALHHPLFPRKGRYVDNEDALMQVLTTHNVRMALAGHTHVKDRWRINATDIITAEGVMGRKKYRIIEVGPEKIDFSTRDFAEKTTTFEYSIDRKVPVVPDWRIISPEPDTRVPSGLDVEVWAPGFVEMEYLVDWGLSGKLRKTGDAFTATVPRDAMPKGKHLLRITNTREKNVIHTMSVPFRRSWRKSRIVFDFDAGAEIQSSPILVSYKTFFGLKRINALCFGANDGNVYMVDRPTGKTLWKVKTGQPVLCAPTYWRGRIFVGSDSGRIYSLKASNGRKLWDFPTDGAIYSTPNVVNGTVYFGSGDGHVYAFDARSGNLRWRFKTGKHVKNRPLFAAGNIIFGSWDMFFYAVDAISGELAWKIQVAEDPHYAIATSNPVLADGKIIVSSHDYNVHAYDPETGDEIWLAEKTDTRKPSYSTAAVLDGKVYYGSITGHIVCLDLETGKEIWNTEVGEALFDSSPVIHDGRVYVGSTGGKIFGADTETGELVDTYSLGSSCVFSSPTAADGVLYVGSLDGHMYGIDISD